MNNVIPMPGIPDRTSFPWNALIARAGRVGRTVKFRGAPAKADEVRITTDDPRELLARVVAAERAA